MNPNIEVITPELWAVNSEYIKAGWIRELSPIPGMESANKYASLTNDGIMILKKESEFYPLLKQFVPKIMQHTDEELLLCHKVNKNTVFDDYKKLYLNVMEWEIERRRVRAAYMNSFPFHRIRNFIKEIIKKVGEKYGNYQNSD